MWNSEYRRGEGAEGGGNVQEEVYLMVSGEDCRGPKKKITPVVQESKSRLGSLKRSVEITLVRDVSFLG